MGRFQNLRDEGAFAPTLPRNNSRAVARKRAQKAAATSRQTPTTPFLIASDQNIKNRVNSLKTNDKIFFNR
jgi:hypothetical protein